MLSGFGVTSYRLSRLGKLSTCSVVHVQTKQIVPSRDGATQ